MQEVTSPNNLRDGMEDPSEAALDSYLNLASAPHESFEQTSIDDACKRSKDFHEKNQIIADILRRAILKDHYTFPGEEINAALKRFDSGAGLNKRFGNFQKQANNGSTRDLSLKVADKYENLSYVENHPPEFPLGTNTSEDPKFDEYIEIHKDEIVCGFNGYMPPHLRKYWVQRNRLFSRYDEGILMDEEGWFSVTPELVARQIAKRMACDVIIDAFCGIGGNAIQFANTCKHVIAIDNNATRLAFAKHNAKVYGVGHKIEFILGDFFELASSLKADAIFLSPPWGGPAYNKVPVFDIHTMMPFSGMKLFKLCSAITPNIGFFLPRNTDYNQLACLATPIAKCEIEEAYSASKFIAITAYFGKIASS